LVIARRLTHNRYLGAAVHQWPENAHIDYGYDHHSNRPGYRSMSDEGW